MTDLTGGLQDALYRALNEISGLTPVVSEVPTTTVGGQEVAQYPFTLLGDDNVTPEGGKGEQFERHEVAVHVCMQSVPKIQVRARQELVRTRLESGPLLTAPGCVFSVPAQLSAATPLLDDGATYVGSQVFLIFAQPAR